MNYKLTNLRIETASGNRISGQDEASKYLTATAFNPMNRFEKSHTIVIFDKGMVEYYRNLLPESRGGLLPDKVGDVEWSENNLDMMDKMFANGCTVEYDLNGLYCRRYTSDIIDANGNVIPGKAAGNIICDANGNPVVFSKISVFCKYAFKTEPLVDEYGMPIYNEKGLYKVRIVRDQNGNAVEEWVDGWSPYEVGERMRRLLTPYSDAVRAEAAVGTGANTGRVQVDEPPHIFGDGQQNANNNAQGNAQGNAQQNVQGNAQNTNGNAQGTTVSNG